MERPDSTGRGAKAYDSVKRYLGGTIGAAKPTAQYCARYIAGWRGKGESETGTNHVGFRLVRDVDKQKAARS